MYARWRSVSAAVARSLMAKKRWLMTEKRGRVGYIRIDEMARRRGAAEIVVAVKSLAAKQRRFLYRRDSSS